MHSSIDIAKYFLLKARFENEPLSNLKLQKLVYIAYGLYLANSGGIPLFKERIEAWSYGPVIRALYDKLKIYGNGDIPYNPGFDLTQELNFTPDAKEILDLTWETFKSQSAIKLSNWTHREDSPWTKAFAENNPVIPDEEIKKYFMPFITYAE